MKERRFPFIIKGKGPLFFREGEKFYPYPIPEPELYPEFPWPKSLCEHAPECPVSDDLPIPVPTPCRTDVLCS